MHKFLLLGFSACLLLSGCHRPGAKPPSSAGKRATVAPAVPAPPRDVLILHERGVEGAEALATLVAHFERRSAVRPAAEYQAGEVKQYRTAFYLAGEKADPARARLCTDLAGYSGTAVWVGPGVGDLDEKKLSALGVTASAEAAAVTETPVTYHGQTHAERLAISAVKTTRGAHVLAQAGPDAFLCGQGKLWYAAAPPSLAREHFWTACIWADALHEIMGEPHQHPRALVAVLRDVPVWANEGQVKDAVGPVLKAGVPVTLLATVKYRDVALGDRPHAVEGLRRAEALGATVALSSPEARDPRDQLRLAWEVGLHPVAWQGGGNAANPFRLRFAETEASPPYEAGGLLPAPVACSDAGRLADDDRARLGMQGVVRDAVAVVSFGMWASPSSFLQFVRGRKASGWRITDLRELGVEVSDPRRVVTSRHITLRTAKQDRFRVTKFSRDWKAQETRTVEASLQVTLAPPAGGVVTLEPAPAEARRELITAVTLDPWAYGHAGLSSKALASALAERYQAHGVNAVFCYVYNVEAGAAYHTRYSGATISDWGDDDLLGNLLDACHSRGIRVIAWLYSGRDEGRWTRHPDWRERTADGKDYNPLRLHAAYFLCPRNAEVRRWYAGLLRDLTEHYPTLDGVELCEPLVNWYGNTACYCETCRTEFARAHPGEPLGGAEWRRFRAEGLTEFLSGCINEVAQQGIETYVMTICDALDNGAILTPRRQWEESGFDLEALLEGPNPPDWVNFEIIWQQWAVISRYGTDVFNPDWAAETARRLSRRVDGRAKVVLHLELTDFGLQLMTPERLDETIRKVMSADPDGVECYHSGAFDRKSAWPYLARTYEEIKR
jgi:hypothetical protein